MSEQDEFDRWFKSYTMMYCQKCGTNSKVQEEAWKRIDNE